MGNPEWGQVTCMNMASHLTVIFIKIMVVTVVCNPWDDAFTPPTCKVDVSCLFL